jgi:hypothetical protein
MPTSTLPVGLWLVVFGTIAAAFAAKRCLPGDQAHDQDSPMRSPSTYLLIFAVILALVGIALDWREFYSVHRTLMIGGVCLMHMGSMIRTFVIRSSSMFGIGEATPRYFNTPLTTALILGSMLIGTGLFTRPVPMISYRAVDAAFFVALMMMFWGVPVSQAHGLRNKSMAM